jgi:HEAT repeats/Secretion system C-terminal sorting domain
VGLDMSKIAHFVTILLILICVDLHSDDYSEISFTDFELEILNAKGSYYDLSDYSSVDLLSYVNHANDDIDLKLLHTVIGKEIIYRLRTKQTDPEEILSQINTSDKKDNTLYLAILKSSVTCFDIEDIRKTFNISQSFASEKVSQDDQTRLIALITSNRAATTLYSSDQFDNDYNYYTRFLTDIAINKYENPDIRRAAIKGISELDYKQAIPDLVSIIQDEENISIPQVTRSTCIALGKFGANDAIAPIEHILTATDDKYIYGSAAIALSDIGTQEALCVLIDNERFIDSDFAAVSIRKQYDQVIDLLHSSDQELKILGIKASKHFFENEHVNQIKSIMLDILTESVDTQIILMILESLQQQIDRDEAKQIIELVDYKDEYSDEYEWIFKYAHSLPIEVKQSSVPIIALEQASSTACEYGDPAYRENGFLLIAERGHTGLMAGINTSNQLRILEVDKEDTTFGVYDNSWSGMVEAEEFWGVNTLSNTTLDFYDRRNIVSTAVALSGYDIGYPVSVLGNVDMLSHETSPGSWVDEYEITELRCDGLVEYCYELWGFEIWGKNSDHYNISKTEWVEEHNDFYSWPHNACKETSPDIQCGRSTDGGICTYMTATATKDNPTYNTYYIYDCETELLDLFITATDQSGIHYIKARKAGGPVMISSIQPQHPLSNSFSYKFTFSLESSENIYFFAKDNAGNYPDNYLSVYINTDAGEPSIPGAPNTSNSHPCRDNDYSISWSAISGADSYRLYENDIRIYDGAGLGMIRNQSNGEFDYKLAAGNNCGWSVTGDITSVSIAQIPPTSSITLIDPNYGDTIAVPFEFTWNQIDDAINYRLQIDESRNYLFPIDDTVIQTPSCTINSLHQYPIYYWRIKAENDCGWSDWSGSRLFFLTTTTAIHEVDLDVLPDNYSLSQNYPNPFNPETNIEFSVPKQSDIRIDIFNINGTKIRSLVDRSLSPGIWRVTWDGTNIHGTQVASGIYLYRLITDGYTESKKMILLK